MRHRKRTAKLGRTSEHRNAMLANLVCSLIRNKRVKTTLAKAKAARPVAEKMVTFGKRGTVHTRRLAAARLKYNGRRMLPSREMRLKVRKNDVIRILFEEIAPSFKDRNGGYTRIIKLQERKGDAAPLAILEWVDAVAPVSGGEPEAKAPDKESAPASTTTDETSSESK